MNKKQEILQFSQTLLAEAEAKGYFYNNLNIRNLPVFEQVKKRDNAFKKELLFHSLRQANVITGEASHREKYDHLNIALHREVVLSLLRAYLDFSPAECIELLRNALMPYEERNMTVFCFWFPLAQVLKHLEKSLEKQTLNQEEQDFLKQCLTTKVGWGNPLKDTLALQIKQVIALNEQKNQNSMNVKPQNQEISQEVKDHFDALVKEVKKSGAYYYNFKVTAFPHYQNLAKKEDTFKKNLLYYAVQITYHWNVEYHKMDTDDHVARHELYNDWNFNVAKNLIGALLRANMGHTFDELAALLELAQIRKDEVDYWFPLPLLIKQVERIAKKPGLTAAQQETLKSWLKISVGWKDNINEKVKLKISEILAQAQGKSIGEIAPVLLDDEDEIGKQINEQIAAFAPEKKSVYYQLLALFKKATQGKPTAKFHQEVEKIKQGIDDEHFNKTLTQWLSDLKQVNPVIEQKTHTYTNHHTNETYQYNYTEYSYFKDSSITFAKGLIWSFVPYLDKNVLQILAEFAQKSFQKIPGKGPLAMSLGNACIYVLAQGGLEGVSYLSRLKLRIRQASTQSLIENYIRTSAEKLGVTPAEIEDMATPSFGLENGKLEEEFEGYKATIRVEGIGKTKLEWFKPDGAPMKSVPSVVKENHKEALKELQNDNKEIQKTLTVQRDRIDRNFSLNRTWTWEAFNTYYFSHGLVSVIAQKLIWVFEKAGKTTDVFYLKGQWVDINEKPISAEDIEQVQLWHPVFRKTEEVQAWRAFMEKHEIQQPLKQAFREIYLLTDAEVNTRSYSNRMAAHILKQHQFNSLAKIRGWKYSLLGAYDKGYDTETATLQLPEGYKAEFWVQEVYADGEWNDTGIYNYVSTDQVRFYQNGTQLNMTEVPALLFSEAMRDVDLFVGVASVGNDPNWRDGGLQEYRTYWESYSFGDLTEVAKTRKQVLEKIIPRLKIAKQCEITDKFLVVKGSLRTYKIHIGSGNILMEPNDQYLCIVADRKSEDVGSKVFLPFEGDSVLSIIISKAMLLAEDTKIKDTTITSQINRK